MNPIQVAMYARVSSEQQNEANTIQSQIADLRARIAAQGLTLLPEQEFVDNGYSGATLIRPALERLRDVAAAGGIDQLYVHCASSLSAQLRSSGALTRRVPASRSRSRVPQPRSGADARRSAPLASPRDEGPRTNGRKSWNGVDEENGTLLKWAT
jgi:hypothetical protein